MSFTIDASRAPQVATILGAEGETAARAEAGRLLEEFRGEKLKRPVWRTCGCTCLCQTRWRDEWKWLHSMGSCPACREPEHQASGLERVRRLDGTP